MFVESAFITKEFKNEPIPILERITCLSVVNKGSSIAVVNGILIYPSQKQILIVPDMTFCKVELSVSYLPTSTMIKTQVSPENKILLIYKKLI